jgi:hypothetical protein
LDARIYANPELKFKHNGGSMAIFSQTKISTPRLSTAAAGKKMMVLRSRRFVCPTSPIGITRSAAIFEQSGAAEYKPNPDKPELNIEY